MHPTRSGRLGIAIFIVVVFALGFFSRGLWEQLSESSPSPASHDAAVPETEGSNLVRERDAPDTVVAGNTRDDVGKTRDYSEEIAELEAEATAGSATARRKLAWAYDGCLGYSYDPDGYLATIDVLAEFSRSSRQAYEGLKNRLAQPCSSANGGRPILLEDIQGLLQSAAADGDLAAQVRLKVFSTGPFDPLDVEAMESLLGLVISSRDADAMLAMSELVGRPLDGPLEAGHDLLWHGSDAMAAWAIAGCRAGADCTHGSVFMDIICMSTSQCDYLNYETLLRQHMVPPGQVPHMEELIWQILSGPGE